MGDVFEAIDRVTGAPVAVKVIQARRVHDSGDLRRFLVEARAAAAVSHTGIVRTFDVDVTPDGTIFQVMELLKGVTMAEWIARPGLRPIGAVAAAGRVLAEALAAAHAAGVVHRDIKPHNAMLILEAPGIKVLDFGISKVTSGAEDEVGLTKSRAILGTPAYMAPEQLVDSKFAGPASDVYSMGVVLYQAFTGKRPFDGGVERLFASHTEQPPPNVRAGRPDLPVGIADTIMSCLEKDAAARPTALVVAEALAPHADAASLEGEAKLSVSPRRDTIVETVSDEVKVPVDEVTGLTRAS